MEKHKFGTLSDGRESFLFTLTNTSGIQVSVTDFGAAVVSLFVPDRAGKFEDIVLGYDSLDGYISDRSYLGVTIGRCANRIAGARFTLDGLDYHLPVNVGRDHLHGGPGGFHKVLWKAEPAAPSGQALRLTYTSPHGEEGYPGTVSVQVVYTINDNNELVIEYTGTTDRATILNLTHHSYFNLTGVPTNTALGHELQIESDMFIPIGRDLIPIGEIISTAGTPMDFSFRTSIGSRIEAEYEQLRFGIGYDHTWVLKNQTGTIRKGAELYEPDSGRLMTLLTDQPGLQFYSGNVLDGTAQGKKGIAYQRRTGLCLEAQHFPDSPNNPQFPSVVVRPGETYRQTTIHRFSSD